MTTQKYIDIVGNQFVPTVVLVDATGVPYSAGGGGAGGLSDTILTDDSGTQFLARDNGTTITYVTLSGVVYVPSTNIRSVSVAGGATSANQTTEIAKLTTIVANQPAINGDGGANAHITNFPATQAIAPAASAVFNSNISDGVTPSLKVTVAQFHNSDNQILGNSGYALNTGGVSQMLNSLGGLDRQRETGFDNIPAAGIATGTQQLASPIATTLNGAVTLSAVAQNVVLVAVSVTSRGSAQAIQVGSIISVDTGANQEFVYVTGVVVATKTVTGIFLKSHASGAAVSSFAFNQARDSTAADGSAPVGFAAGSMYLFNATLNAGAGGMEIERSAAGELDGATGVGTAVAAEYEYNSGGPMTNVGVPSNLTFDRVRNLQGKGMSATTLNGAVAAGITTVTLTSVVGLQAGSQIRLGRNTGAEESAYVSINYVTGSLAVGLQSATALAHATGIVVEWDIFASGGPGISGFTPAGVSIDEQVLFDPVSGLYYIERAATQDGVQPQNVVLESPGLWNGLSFDRAPGNKTSGMLVSISNPAAILAGQQAGTAAAVALPTSTLINGIIVTALSTNTGTLYVGPAGVTAANGYPLAAGQSISYGVTNLNAIYIVGAVGSVAWTGN